MVVRAADGPTDGTEGSSGPIPSCTCMSLGYCHNVSRHGRVKSQIVKVFNFYAHVSQPKSPLMSSNCDPLLCGTVTHFRLAFQVIHACLGSRVYPFRCAVGL